MPSAYMGRIVNGSVSMILHSKKRSIPATIVRDPDIMGGVPTVRGTRIPVEMILIHVRGGYSREAIFNAYPSLPLDGIEACVAWAEQEFGHDWREHPAAA
jgi:uncharacterized protein (DUF433 family)